MAKTVLLLLVAVALTACASNERLSGAPDQAAVQPPAPPAAPPPPPPPTPPPVDLAGKWKLSATGGACFMTFGAAPGADAGTIAPAGGCPGKFFTSRKWTYEHERLVIRDNRSEVLVELAFAGGRFEGKELNGAAVLLSR